MTTAEAPYCVRREASVGMPMAHPCDLSDSMRSPASGFGRLAKLDKRGIPGDLEWPYMRGLVSHRAAGDKGTAEVYLRFGALLVHGET